MTIPTWSSFRSTSRTRIARTRSPITIARAARTSRSAGCTSRRCPTKRRRTRTRSSSGRASTRFRSFCRTSRPERRDSVTSPSVRTLKELPPIRRDLIQRHRYLVPNSIVVSRGCPHHCTFCYKDGFFAGGRSFYTQLVDDALAEIARLPGRHLYFLDDHLFGNPQFARELFRGMRGMGRVFQGAATVDSILRDDVVEEAAAAGLRSLFVGFETLSSCESRRRRQASEPQPQLSRRRAPPRQPRHHDQRQLRLRPRRRRSRRLLAHRRLGGAVGSHDLHVPHPHAVSRHGAVRGNGSARRIATRNWDLYDTRNVVYRPTSMSPEELKRGYDWAYESFYRWSAIFKASSAHESFKHRAETLLLQRGMEEVRAGVGPRDPHQTVVADAADPRSGARAGGRKITRDTEVTESPPCSLCLSGEST